MVNNIDFIWLKVKWVRSEGILIELLEFAERDAL